MNTPMVVMYTILISAIAGLLGGALLGWKLGVNGLAIAGMIAIGLSVLSLPATNIWNTYVMKKQKEKSNE